MVTVLSTPEFDRWVRRLKDRRSRLRIIDRLDRLAHGHAGDAKSVGRGVYELRFTFGPGYRVYYAQRGSTVLLLLCGGDKSTQQNDIETARVLASQWHEQEGGEAP